MASKQNQGAGRKQGPTQVSRPPSSLNLYDTDSGIFTNPGELQVLTRYLLINYENDTKCHPSG